MTQEENTPQGGIPRHRPPVETGAGEDQPETGESSVSLKTVPAGAIGTEGEGSARRGTIPSSSLLPPGTMRRLGGGKDTQE